MTPITKEQWCKIAIALGYQAGRLCDEAWNLVAKCNPTLMLPIATRDVGSYYAANGMVYRINTCDPRDDTAVLPSYTNSREMAVDLTAALNAARRGK